MTFQIWMAFFIGVACGALILAFWAYRLDETARAMRGTLLVAVAKTLEDSELTTIEEYREYLYAGGDVLCRGELLKEVEHLLKKR